MRPQKREAGHLVSTPGFEGMHHEMILFFLKTTGMSLLVHITMTMEMMSFLREDWKMISGRVPDLV